MKIRITPRSAVFVGLCTLLLSACSAQQEAPPATTVDVAKLFDGREVRRDVRLTIRDGRIISVDDRAGASTGDKHVDLGTATVIPGLIAAHSHVGMVNGVDAGGHNYTRETVAKDLRQFQRYGVVAVNALGMNGSLFHDLRKAPQDGSQADLYGAGGGVGAVAGAPPASMNPPDALVRAATPDEARAAVDRMAEAGVDMIKVWVDDLNHQVPRMAPEIYTAAIAQAHKHGLKAAAHIHYLEDAKGVVRAGADIVGHGVRDVPVDQEFIELLLARGVTYVPTIQINEAEYLYAERPELLDDPFFRKALNPALEARFRDEAWRAAALARAEGPRRAVATNVANLRRLHEAGVKIAFGTDSGATPLRIPGFAEHLELAHMVSAGMTPVEALTAATTSSAALLSQDDRGCLRAGCRADFVVLSGDPTQDITATRTITAVWRNGAPVVSD